MRNEITVNLPVAKTRCGEIVFIHYIFSHGPDFQGATTSRFVPVSAEEVEERNDPEYVKDCYDGEYLWKEAVSGGHTELGLDDYIEAIIEEERHGDGEYFGHDTSYIYECGDALKELCPDAATFECVGGGRMGSDDVDNYYSEIINPELLELCRELEGGAITFEEAAKRFEAIKGKAA